MNDFNVIYGDEEIFGFIGDIVRSLESDLSQCEEYDKELLEDAIKRAKKIEEEEYSPYSPIYRCWYNPMGAFMFDRYERIEK